MKNFLSAKHVFMGAALLTLVGSLIACIVGSSRPSVQSPSTAHQRLPASQPINGSLLFCNRVDDLRPVSRFIYPSPIVAFVNFAKTLQGQHTLIGKWIKPNGETEQTTQLNLDFGQPGSRSAYFWLQFQEESSLDVLRLGSDDKHSRNGFSGTWILDVSCDGQAVAHSTFSVVEG